MVVNGARDHIYSNETMRSRYLAHAFRKELEMLAEP